MEDDPLLTRIDDTGRRIVFALVEVKADLCKINGPWTDPRKENMQRVVRRLGFAGEPLVAEIAAKMYDSARWEDDAHVLQYICVGGRKNDGIQRRFPGLSQIVWNEMADFFWRRFAEFPEKLPDGKSVHAQWTEFGRKYGEWFGSRTARDGDSTSSRLAVSRYIETNKCFERSSG